MIQIAASIWNKIAETQKLESPAAKIAFQLDQEQLAEMERFWMILREDIKTPTRVARCLPTFVPLLTEHEAISSFVSQHPALRNALPEVLDPHEAVTLATMDYRLAPDEQELLAKVLSSPRVLSEWAIAATAAARV
jgi:hypothetical protein